VSVVASLTAWIGAERARYERGKAINLANAEKRRVAALRRRERHRLAVAEAQAELSRVDRYVFGIDGETIVRNRRRVEREEYAEMRAEFRAEYEDEIADELAEVLAGRSWWGGGPTSRERRAAESRVWRRHGAEFRGEYDDDQEDELLDVERDAQEYIDQSREYDESWRIPGRF
jgi:hypothetical protein